MVATSGDNVADVGVFAAADRGPSVAVDVTVFRATAVLDVGVDLIDLFVGGCHHRGGLAGDVVLEPFVGEVVEVLVERCWLGPGRVLGRCRGLAGRRCGAGVRRGLPMVRGKRWACSELMVRPVEHNSLNIPPLTDRLELSGIADQGDQLPPVVFGELDELVEVAGAEHPGLIDDQRATRWQLPPRIGWPVGSGPFVEEFGDCVARHPGLALQCPCCFGGR